ncbi:hypothetical protein GCU56_13385 [Geodermatophilus sabuli]|uniref:Uncharacterized protein n=1 Tax=Geodermatophilus sabuli TaxID=1564158 RepID=A0A7K3W1V3_9ACTN|nr:hypothetical protein [Geodermatophilus sabuli]NEK58861.1 hypothetical protein [Geodermatophilus sabuli]
MGEDRDQAPARSAATRPGPRLCLAAACAVLAVAATLVLRSGRDPVPAPAAAPSASVPAPVDVLGLPTRGSLAGDPAFLDGVRRLPWTVRESTVGPGLPDAPVDSRRVVFAGDVPGGRWALVVGAHTLAAGVPADPPGPPDGDLAAAWFAGPPGARPDQMRLRTVPRRAPPGQPVAMVDPATGALAVVAAPGDVVEVSDHPDISADGDAARSYRRVPVEAGVAVVALPPNDLLLTAVAYRVVRDWTQVVRTKPDPFPAPPSRPAPVLLRRELPSAAAERLVQRAATAVLERLGLPPADVQVAAEWAGDVPVPRGGTGTAAVVTVTVPSGAVVVNTEWAVPGPGGAVSHTRCSLAIEPAGIPTDRRVHAMACGARTGGRTASWTSLVVVGPPMVAVVRAHDARGAFLAEHRATDGVVVAPFPRGTATVEAVTDGGVSLGRVRLLGQAADFGS